MRSKKPSQLVLGSSLAILAAAVLFSILGINDYPLTGDEARICFMAQQPWTGFFWFKETAYTSGAAALTFVSSAGVTVGIAASSSGWSASATHSALGASEGCAIYYGTATAPTSPTTPSSPGEVACTA